MGDSPAEENEPYNPELLTTVTFTTPPPSLLLVERTKKAITEFDVILDSYLDMEYRPMWRGLQVLVTHLAEQSSPQQQNAEHHEQQRREQSVAQEDRLGRVEHILNKLLSRPQNPPSPPQTYAAALRSGLTPSPPDRDSWVERSGG
jgi:hypothetical protein